LDRAHRLFIVLNALFLVCLFMAEVTGAKLFTVDVPDFGFPPLIGPWFTVSAFTMTLGVIPFPVTFLVTDLMNEYFGKSGVRFTTLVGMGCIVLAYGLIFLDLQIAADPERSPVSDEAFQAVFANSSRIIVASITAYLVGQLIDIQVFHRLRTWTGNRHIWLRATGSTLVSQLFDSFIVIYLAFGLRGQGGKEPWPFALVAEVATTNYLYKFAIAVLITPLLYLGHRAMDRYLGHAEAARLRDRALSDTSFRLDPQGAGVT
jgi:queuosine precursor transporter